MTGGGFTVNNKKFPAPFHVKTKKLISEIIAEGLLAGSEFMDV